MLGLFKPRLPIDDEEFEWLLATFAWLLREFGGNSDLRDAELILPDQRFFPASRLTGHARAFELFEQVKAHAGMEAWPCELVAGTPERERRVTDGHALRHESPAPPLGTFGRSGGRCYVSYNPSELRHPQSLVATFAHELAHYLMRTAETPPPGGRDLIEHATDLAAVFLGFGIFMANSAKDFRQFQDFGEQGWEMRGRGYLSENALVAALALFVTLSDASAREAGQGLKDYLRKPFRNARKAIARDYPDLRGALADVDFGEWHLE